jgi:kinesin family protein 15
MLEIYNENITDLLNPNATNLQIREDIKRGCYVEDLSEHSIQNGRSGAV